MANRDVVVFDNDIGDNGTANIIVTSYWTTFEDPNYNPLPRNVMIRNNRFGNTGFAPSGDIAALARSGVALPDVLWDGVTTYAAGGVPHSENVRIVMRDNRSSRGGIGTFLSMGLPASGTPLTEGNPEYGVPAAADIRRAEPGALASLMRSLAALLAAAAALAWAARRRKRRPASTRARSRRPNPPPLLSAYHFFRDAGARQAERGRDALRPQHGALFRWRAQIPLSLSAAAYAQAAYRDDGVFDLPVGAVLIKTFAFAADMRRPTENVRFLETRLLIHRANGWVAYPYVWNQAQTEARLSPIGATMPITFTDTDGQRSRPRLGRAQTSISARAATIAPARLCRSGQRRATSTAGSIMATAPKASSPIGMAAGMIDRAPADAPRLADAYDPHKRRAGGSGARLSASELRPLPQSGRTGAHVGSRSALQRHHAGAMGRAQAAGGGRTRLVDASSLTSRPAIPSNRS